MLDIKNKLVIYIFGQEIWITETIVNTWIIMGIILVFGIFTKIIFSNYEKVPNKAQNIIESGVEMFNNFAYQNLNPQIRYMTSCFFAVFVFILFSTISSVFGLRAPTADWATTFALSLSTFVLMVFSGFKYQGKNYMKKTLTVPHWLFAPVNFIGELAKPISLSFRLFGNTLSGTIMITLYMNLTPTLANIGFPALMNIFFDIIMGALQTYIFVILSIMYLNGAVED